MSLREFGALIILAELGMVSLLMLAAILAAFNIGELITIDSGRRIWYTWTLRATVGWRQISVGPE